MSFCVKMNSTLLKKISLFAVVMLFLMPGSVAAQTEKQPVRRNSPFSPNPKKRIETANTTLQNTEPVKIVKVSETENTSNNEIPDGNSETPVTSNEIPENAQNENFDNRSIAKKTLEVAKRASEANVSPSEIYKIGVGDILFIGLQGAPSKETNYFTVLQDGTIDYPLAGEMISVLGLTVEDIEDFLREKIKLYENPQVSVKIREYNSHTYTVLGLVEKSGEKFLQREAIPLFVVRAEAIVQSKANRATIKRKDSDTQTIDLKDPKYGETLVFSGDIVEFSFEDAAGNIAKVPQFYYIGGEIVSGGQKDFYQGITLTQAILASGGLKKSTVKKVIVRRKNEAGMLTPTEYDLKAIKDGKSADPAIEAGDTIEIEN